MSVATVTTYADLMRDVRHLAARAATDLADWLAFLTVDGKASRTLYAMGHEDPSTTKKFYPSTSDLDVARRISELIV